MLPHFASTEALARLDFVGQRYHIAPAAQVGIVGTDQLSLYHAFCFNEASAMAGIAAERKVRDEYDREHSTGDYAPGGSKSGNVLRLPNNRTSASSQYKTERPNTAEIRDTPDGPIIFGTVPYIGK